MIRVSLWFAFLICIFAGYLLGHVSYKIAPKAFRKISSVNTSINSYDVLKCIPDSVYREKAKALNLEVPAGDICGDPYHGKMSRLFWLMDTFTFHFSSDWAPELQNDFRKPYDYLKKYDHSLGFDLAAGADSTEAYNTTDTRHPNLLRGRSHGLLLGALFFKEDPLDALPILIHEARHSSPHDPAHAQCVLGDIQRYDGGCDQELSVKEGSAGAYSYGAAFYAALSLYADGLSEGDREYLKTEGLRIVTLRFNVLPDELAQRYDLLAALKKDGTVAYIHPFVAAVIPGPNFEEKIKRVEQYPSHGGLMAFAESNRVFNFQLPFTQKPELVFEKSGGANFRALEISRIFAKPTEMQPYPYYTVLKENNDLEFQQFNPEKGAYEFLPYAIFRFSIKNPEIPKHKYFFLGMWHENIFISEEGVVYRTYHFASEPHWVRLPTPESNRWVSGTGGLLAGELYLISQAGRLYNTEAFFQQEEDDNTPEPEYRIGPSKLPMPNVPLVKLREGLNLRSVLDRNGTLYVARYGDVPRAIKVNEPFSDFTIVRPTVTEKPLMEMRPSSEFEEKCGISHTILDPWLQGAIGIDSKQHLVFATPGGDGSINCYVDQHGGPYLSVRVRNVVDGGVNKNPYELPSAELELRKTDGTYEVRRPYEY